MPLPENSSRKEPAILCAGGATQDIVMQVDEFPQAGGKVQGSNFVITTGGQAGNAAVAIARLGGRVRYAGPVGSRDDNVANRIVSLLEAENIDCSYAARVPDASSSVSLIMIDPSGEKMISTRRPKGLNGVGPADADAVVAGIDAVLLDNRYADFTLPTGAAARRAGIPVVIDLDRATAPSLEDPLVKTGTHIISSAEAMRGSTGADDLAQALKIFSRSVDAFVAVTDGPKGVYWLDGDTVRHMPAYQVKAIDTLGAGDTFHGAFVYKLLESGDLVEAMRFGSAAAAIKCTRFGGLAGAPTRTEVEAFLGGQKPLAIE